MGDRFAFRIMQHFEGHMTESATVRKLFVLKPTLLELANCALSALQDPALWYEYLAAFCRHFDARASYLALFGNQFDFGMVAIYHGFPPSDIELWEKEWAHRDPWMQGRDLNSLPLERAVPSQQLCPDEQLMRQPIYEQFLKPRQLHYGGGVNFLRTPDISAVQIVLRSRETGPLTEQELTEWNQIVPYVKTAVSASLEQSRLRSENELYNDHFASLGNGLIFLSPTGRIHRMNDTARGILSHRPDILCKDGHLSFTKPNLDAELRSILRDFAGDFKANSRQSVARKIAVPREASLNTAPLLVVLTAVHKPSARSFDPNSFTILLHLIESQQIAPADTKVLEKLFGWTPTEARLAGLLATGQSLEEVTAQMNISIQTGRTHLKHVFAKTGFNRQGELIAFINRLTLRDPAR